MSFSKTSKIEIINSHLETADTAFAFLSGLLHSCGQLEKNSKGFRVSIISDLKELFPFVNELVKSLYGNELALNIENDYVINKTPYYRIEIPSSCAQSLLVDCGLLGLVDGDYQFISGVEPNILPNDETKIAFLRGAYIGCGTSSIRLSEREEEKTTSGYHLELSSHNYDFLSDTSSILSEFGIFSRLVERKNNFVLYLKEAESIKDLLALVGANESVLALSNEMIRREKRNQINREVNCINANISKTVDASIKQIDAINTIISTIGLESLEETLQEVAMLRLANPEESLEELKSLSSINLSKSGLNHRLNKLIKIAQELK